MLPLAKKKASIGNFFLNSDKPRRTIRHVELVIRAKLNEETESIILLITR